MAHLKAGLQSSNPDILCQSIRGLGAIRAEIDLVLPFLAFNDQRVRLNTVKALGGIGGEKAIDSLMGLLTDDDLAIRWLAQESLDKLLSTKTDITQPEGDKAETPVPGRPQEAQRRLDEEADVDLDLPF